MKNNKTSSLALRILLSLVVALVLWIFVDLQDPATVSKAFKSLPVEFEGEDTTLMDNGLMLTSGFDQTVDIKLRAPRNILAKLKPENIHIICDTSEITTSGEQELTWSISYSDISSYSISLIDSSSTAITVNVQELYTKEVPVYCEIVGDVAQGYFAGDVSYDPQYITLRAEEDNLININYAKVVVNIDGAKSSVVETLAYSLYDYNDAKVDATGIRSNIKAIQVTLPIRTLKEVPLQIVLPDANSFNKNDYEVSITPSTVVLLGEAEKLNNIDSIIIYEAYIAEVESVLSETVDIVPPSGTYLQGETTKATFTISVSSAEEREYEIENISLENVPAGLTASYDSVQIVLTGSKTVLDGFNSANISCSVDLSSVTSAGTYELPIKVDIGEQSFIGIKGDYNLKIEVKDSK